MKASKANKDKNVDRRLRALLMRANGKKLAEIASVTGYSFGYTVKNMIMLCCDGAAWHKSKTLQVLENIVLFYNPPYTQEMNSIEQIWISE